MCSPCLRVSVANVRDPRLSYPSRLTIDLVALERGEHRALGIGQDRETSRSWNWCRADHQLATVGGGGADASVQACDLEIWHPVRRDVRRHFHDAAYRLPANAELAVLGGRARAAVLDGPAEHPGIERLGLLRISRRQLAPAECARLVVDFDADVFLRLPQVEHR